MELSKEANTSASHDSVVMNFTTPKTFLLLKCSFGLTFGSKSIKVRALILQAITPCKKLVIRTHETMKNVHSGQSGVTNIAGYITMFDAAFCYICI